jgi:multidrug efflux system outer membrane protein
MEVLLAKIKWLPLLSILILSGCQFNSSPKKLAIPIPAQWPKNNLKTSGKSVYLPKLYWWKKFHNHELNKLIVKARQSNNRVQLALTNIESAQSELQRVRWEWFPKVTMFGGYTEFPVFGNPGTMAIAYPSFIVNIFKLYHQQQQARAELEATVNNKYNVELLIIAETVSSYFTLLAQIERLKLNQQLLKELKEFYNLANRQFRSRLISFDRLTEIKLQMMQLQGQISVIEHNIFVSKNALHFLLNENPGALDIAHTFADIHDNALIPSNIPASVLCTRPDVREAHARLQSAAASVNIAVGGLFPLVNLGAFLGHGSKVGKISLGQAFLQEDLINLPLLAEISKTKAQCRAAVISYVATVRQALQEASNGLSAYAAYQQQLLHFENSLNELEQQCRLIDSRFRYGLEDKVKLTECRVHLTELRLIINQKKLDKLFALVNLYLALGGGYDRHG